MPDCHYQIYRHDRLLHLAVSGVLRRTDLSQMEQAFWSAWEQENRLLMDFSDLTTVDMSVADFTQAGLSGQTTMQPQRSDMRAAYVASTPNVFAFMRIVESVWSSHLEVATFQTLEQALTWLGYGELNVDDGKLVASG